jgi:acetylornithine deacetylase/succinyl-diaminopimelate desuccinylase-like protein
MYRMRALPPLVVALALPLAAQSPYQQLAREILKELIEINTTDTAGDNTRAAEAMAARFRKAGYPAGDVQVLAPVPKKGNLVVRLRGDASARPVLFLGHLDVVEALRADWSSDPFLLREQDGYFYGRGTQDTKANDAALVAAFLRMKQENFRPARDLILALTADEETGPANGVDWLVKNRRSLIDAEFCINTDGGGGAMRNGKRLRLGLEAAQKVFVSYKLEVTNPGGHSSLPTRDNAIYHLAEGLARLAKYDFPVHMFDVTRAAFAQSAPVYDGQMRSDLLRMAKDPPSSAVVARLSRVPRFNAQMRTTCVATQVSAGHAENALPQRAVATVNCRVLPVDRPADVRRTLERVLADPEIHITEMNEPVAPGQKPMDPRIVQTVTDVAAKLWPGVPLIPVMDTGASDSIYLLRAGIPAYGAGGLFVDEDDIRAHGRDERIRVGAFYGGVDFMWELVTRFGRLK